MTSRRAGLAVLMLAVLGASPLFGGARIVSNNSSSSPVETVNWTAGVSYSYDGSGNIRRIGNDRFAYDQAGRLVRATVNGKERRYVYDAFGNRTECTHAPGQPEESDCQFGLEVDSKLNRLEGVHYDARGNVVAFGGHTYSYDAVNMARRDQFGVLAREYVYTADDERIATYRVGSTWHWTVRDATGRVLREFTSEADGSSSTRWTRDNVWRDGLLLASRQLLAGAPVTRHYHLDHLGTPRRVTDETDVTVGFHDYYAFGPEVSGGLDEPAATSLQYTGHERDKWSGEGMGTLDYMHARYYSPHAGRFLTVDPSATAHLQSPQTWNLYAYVGNDPIGHFDPDGRNKVVYWALGKAKHFWRRVERKQAVREVPRSTKDNPHNVQVEGPGSSRKAKGVIEEAFPGQQTVRHDAHSGGPSNPMDKHKPHHQLKKSRKQGGGQVNYAKIIKTVVGFVPYIGWAVDAEAATTSDANPIVEQRAQDMYGASFYDLNDEERKEVVTSLREDQKRQERDAATPPPCPYGKIHGTSGPCD